MKSSKNLKVGVTLLVIALAVGVFAFVVWADGNGTYGEGRGLSVNNGSSRYGMQNKGVSNQGQNQDCEGCVEEGLGNGMGRRIDVPDDDNDGIPNGQDSDYTQHNCDEECDGTCDSEPKGNSWGINSSDSITGLQVHVSGMEMKTMTIADIASLWGIEDAEQLLINIKNEFSLTQEYNTNNTIDDLRREYRFSPYQIMEIAQRIKTAVPVE